MGSKVVTVVQIIRGIGEVGFIGVVTVNIEGP